jgi:Uma2 family endonuclease
MNGIPTPQTLPARPEEIFYPCEDDTPLAEGEAHLLVIFHLIATLRQFFAPRPDCYVIGDMFLYYEEGNPEARRAPDVMVVKGVEPKPLRDFFKIWEEHAVPCVIFEITSPSTADEDTEAKFRLYEQLGVNEYFLFDPRSEYLEQQLIGYRLVGKRYEPLIPSSAGCLVSNEMQILLCPEGIQLALLDFKTGKRLPTPEETSELWRKAEAETANVRKWAESAVASAECRSAEAERHAAELAAEVARLRSAATGTEPTPPPA